MSDDRLRHNYLERIADARREADKEAVSPLEKARYALGGDKVCTCPVAAIDAMGDADLTDTRCPRHGNEAA